MLCFLSPHLCKISTDLMVFLKDFTIKYDCLMLYTNAFFSIQACQDDFEWVRKWALLVKLRLRVSQTEKPTAYMMEIWVDRTEICGDFNGYSNLELS